MAAGAAKGNRGQPTFPTNEAPDLGVDEEAVSNFAAVVGTRRVGTTAERNALIAPELFVGLAWGDTTDGAEHKYLSGGWKRLSPTRGIATFTTDAAGLGAISHGLGTTPVAVSLTPAHTTDAVASVFKPVAGALSGSSIQVVCFRSDTSARLATTSVQVHWVAFP